MRQKPDTLRIAAAALFASVALPSTSLAQQAPVVVTPPPAAATPAPAPNPIVVTPRPAPVTPSPVTTTPPIATTPPVARPTPAPQPTIRAPAPAARAPAPATRAPARAERPAQRPAPRARTAAPAERPAPAPAPVPEAAAPATPAEALPPAPVATTPIPVEATTPVTTPPANPTATGALWAMIAAGAVLLAFLAFFLFRRRRDEDVYETVHEEAPAAAGAGVAAPREGDIEALLETSKPPVGRPWLELLLRPVRAGTTPDQARVDFELTVGNTGSVPARDVTVSTWMLAEGATEMERSLISPPAEAHQSHLDIPAHEGARLDTTVALPTDGLDGAVLPVVAAEVRYRLPDGREGRTAASFAIGRADGEALAPFAVDRPSGLREDIEVRLHSRPEQV